MLTNSFLAFALGRKIRRSSEVHFKPERKMSSFCEQFTDEFGAAQIFSYFPLSALCSSYISFTSALTSEIQKFNALGSHVVSNFFLCEFLNFPYFMLWLVIALAQA